MERQKRLFHIHGKQLGQVNSCLFFALNSVFLFYYSRMPFFERNIKHDVKYLEELMAETTRYIGLIILNVFNGISENVGIKNPDKLASKPPKKLQKGFLSGLIGIGRRLKNLIGRRKESPKKPFKLKGRQIYKKDGEPYTMEEWKSFENQVAAYMRPYLDNVSEEIAVKGILLALASDEAEKNGKSVEQYGQKSYDQIEKEAFMGYIPDSMLSAEERYDIDTDVKQAMNTSYGKAAEYVSNVEDDVRQAIKEQVIYAHRNKLSGRELASNLYWMKDDVPELKRYSAESLLRDWHRVAYTELAYIHETGKLAAQESQARKSIKNPELAIYYVFNGTARCDWCNPREGTIVRHIPLDKVGDERDDSLSSRGIDDPYAQIAVWQGKNNVGYKKPQWRISAPSHPFCGCTFSRIHPEIQYFDKKSEKIKLKKDVDEKGFIPEDFIKERKEAEAENIARREKMEADRMEGIHKKDVEYYDAPGAKLAGYDDLGMRIVDVDGQKYVEVAQSDYNKRVDEWRLNRTLPIPVGTGQKGHGKYFGGL